MPLPSGSPDVQVIVYAIQRGEYDEELYVIDQAIHRRRDGFDRLGIIQPARGDWVEIFDDDPTRDVKIPTALLGHRLRVVGFTNDKRLRCQVEAPIQTSKRTYERGAIIRVDRDWVYRVHYAPVDRNDA
jgi:hypothetical protein